MEAILKLDDLDAKAFEYAVRWCTNASGNWKVEELLGRGGTAPVFRVIGPDGHRALKLLDPKFCEGDLGAQTERRISLQVELGEHGCPYLIVCHDGGRFEDRLFLLMNCAEGHELEKRLSEVPRSKIRNIVSQIAQAAIFLRQNGLSHRDIKSANIFISDDFERATLLDLSVIRDIYDPVGLGTDHDNELPVVATSRYTPPEYLFRLQDPSPELWHGVDVYQLGGLLHDLIMREPMFSREYASSSENRYRFAWIVATVDPAIRAEDVDDDLILLARRALDKNWDRRRSLRLDDFLVENDANILSLAAIGLSPTLRPVVNVHRGIQPSMARELARALEDLILEHLSNSGMQVTHNARPTVSDRDWEVTWDWKSTGDFVAQNVKLAADIRLIERETGIVVENQVRIFVAVDGLERAADMSLPDIALVEGVEDDLARQVIASLGPLSRSALAAGQGDH